MNLRIESAALSDVGLKRTNNEDSFGVDPESRTFVLCDGMGGHAGGEIASSLAVRSMVAFFRDSPRKSTDVVTQMEHAISLANSAVYKIGHNDSELRGLGSTMVAVHVTNERAIVGHVGDSRAYLVRDGSIRLLTADHSLVAEQVRRGLMTKTKAEASPLQNIILRALGASEDEIGEVQAIDIKEGDFILLACDGLTKFVAEADIAAIIQDAQNLQKKCAALIEKAKANHSDDNITCVLLELRKPPSFGDRIRSFFGHSA